MANSAVFEDALIEARIDEIKTTRDHGFVVSDTELNEHLAAPMQVTSTAEDRAIIYDTETGEPREVLVKMLAQNLKKRRNGKPAFSVSPVKAYVQGSVPCWFNPASEKYAWVSSIPGLETFICNAAHLASEFDAELHAKHRHDRRYLRVKDYEERREKDEAKATQERTIAAMMAMAGAKAADGIFRCDVDGCSRFFDSSQGLAQHKSTGHRE